MFNSGKWRAWKVCNCASKANIRLMAGLYQATIQIKLLQNRVSFQGCHYKFLKSKWDIYYPNCASKTCGSGTGQPNITRKLTTDSGNTGSILERMNEVLQLHFQMKREGKENQLMNCFAFTWCKKNAQALPCSYPQLLTGGSTQYQCLKGTEANRGRIELSENE